MTLVYAGDAQQHGHCAGSGADRAGLLVAPGTAITLTEEQWRVRTLSTRWQKARREDRMTEDMASEA